MQTVNGPGIGPQPSTPTAADFQAVADLMAKFPWMFPNSDARARVTVAEVIDKYLADALEEITERTLDYRRGHLERLRQALGARLVGECTPFMLKECMARWEQHQRSGWTKASVNVSIQRVFNWATKLGVIRENPFRGYTPRGEKKVGRDLKPEEFQALLRFTDPYFRRFLIALKLTGARPGELSALKWSHVDWHRGIATLTAHKTAKKTGAARVIVLVPQVLKLLAIIRRDQHGPAAVELRRMLTYAPNHTVKAKEVVTRMQRLGFTYRAIYRARQAIGATYGRAGGWHKHGYTIYQLPDDAKPERMPYGDYVFVCSKNWPWTRTALGHKFKKLRRLIGLPMDAKLYGCRHLFCTWAVKRGVNLKAVATLLAHKTTAMVERVYSHIDGDYEFLQKAAQSATALSGAPKALPFPTDAEAWQTMVLAKYPKAAPRATGKDWRRRGPRKMNDAERIAYAAYQFARKECPDLETDSNIYAWLMNRPEYAGQLPPSLPTFWRYLTTARRHFEGGTKRELRRGKLNPKVTP